MENNKLISFTLKTFLEMKNQIKFSIINLQKSYFMLHQNIQKKHGGVARQQKVNSCLILCATNMNSLSNRLMNKNTSFQQHIDKEIKQTLLARPRQLHWHVLIAKSQVFFQPFCINEFC